MKTILWQSLIVSCLIAACGAPDRLVAQSPDPAPSRPDIVTLKDGGRLYGEIIEMTGGVLSIKSASSADNMIKIKWDDVAALEVTHPIPFHLKDGTILNGTAAAGPDRTIKIQADPLQGSITVPLSSIESINPLTQPPVVYIGSLNAGFSQATGNSRLRNVSVVGDLVTCSEQLRLTMLGRYVYGTTTACSSRATPGGPSNWTFSSRNGCSGSPRPTSKTTGFKT